MLGEAKDDLTSLEEEGYVKEDQLQKFLAKYPDLLPGDQIDPENPRRWFLVRREMPVYGHQGMFRDWSLDHLSLDQDGVPTLVECKQSSNPEIRRKVIAQMIEYAANATLHWSVETIRNMAARNVGSDEALEEKLGEFLALNGDMRDDIDLNNYWRMVAENLNDKKIRLILLQIVFH